MDDDDHKAGYHSQIVKEYDSVCLNHSEKTMLEVQQFIKNRKESPQKQTK